MRHLEQPATRQDTGPVRTRFLGLAFLPLLLGLLFFEASLTPSLIPRPWVLQGILAGLVTAIGYAIGQFSARRLAGAGAAEPAGAGVFASCACRSGGSCAGDAVLDIAARCRVAEFHTGSLRTGAVGGLQLAEDIRGRRCGLRRLLSARLGGSMVVRLDPASALSDHADADGKCPGAVSSRA